MFFFDRLFMFRSDSDMTPGPGAHDDRKFLSNHYSAPKHSFGKRIPISLRQDPYVNVIPINRA